MTAARSTKPRPAHQSGLVTPAAPAAKPRAKASKPKASTAASAATWHEMVATAAYFRAQARGLQPGSAEQDWLDAEAELMHTMGKLRDS